MRIEVEQGDYKPLCYIRVFAANELIYRRLIRREDEAKWRKKLSKLAA